MVGFKVIIFALSLISYTTWVQANDTKNNLVYDDQTSVSKLNIDEAAYVVAVYQNNIRIGSGSIVTHNLILTSASVVSRANNNTLRVKVGSDGTSEWAFIEVEQTMYHEDYRGYENNICILKLKKAVTGIKNVTSAQIDTSSRYFPLDAGLFVDINGWGVTETGTSTGQLQQTHVPLSECRLRDPAMNEDKLCLTTRGLGVSWGNTGAPMIYENLLIGVASFNTQIGNTVFTRLTKYVAWIDNIITNN